MTTTHPVGTVARITVVKPGTDWSHTYPSALRCAGHWAATSGDSSITVRDNADEAGRLVVYVEPLVADRG